MDYVKPNQVMYDMIEAGAAKARLKTSQMLIRGMLSGAILACATMLAFTASDQTKIPLVGALLFPVGFVMIVLLGLELVTGSFALLPLAVLQKKASSACMLANYGWVILGHLIGCLIYGGLYALIATKMGTDMSHPLIQMLVDTSETKTLGYKALGVSGMLLVVIKAMLCNWMVTLGVVMAFTSSSTIGKIAAMWLPILIFFGQGFEHGVVNMFVIPAGMMLGADVSMADWWFWNQIPVLIGNFIGGAVFTGAMLHVSQFGFGKRSEVNPVAKAHHGLRVMEATAVPVDKRR
jgi:formate/nitrite transporter